MRRAAFAIIVAMSIGCGGSESASVPATGASATPGDAAAPPPADSGTTPPPGDDAGANDAATNPTGMTLEANRDRLIDTLATRKTKTRCALWADLTATQKGVFLTITDLLGKRSPMTASPSAEMALDHVTKVYELRDSNGSNGGGDNNRIWIQVDAQLIAALRDFNGPLPEWAASTDLGGAHAPFDGTSETVHGQPRGQAHFWTADAKSVPLTRPGVEGIDDPHVVEIDIDYDLFHNSNPEGTYFPGGLGRDSYSKVWTPLGAGGGPELDYVPTGCPK